MFSLALFYFGYGFLWYPYNANNRVPLTLHSSAETEMNFKYNQNAQIYPRAHIHILQINKYAIPLTFTVNVKRVKNEISSFEFRFI